MSGRVATGPGGDSCEPIIDRLKHWLMIREAVCSCWLISFTMPTFTSASYTLSTLVTYLAIRGSIRSRNGLKILYARFYLLNILTPVGRVFLPTKARARPRLPERQLQSLGRAARYSYQLLATRFSTTYAPPRRCDFRGVSIRKVSTLR